MGLLDELTPENLVNKFSLKCGMCRVLEELPEAERLRVEELMANESVSKAKLARLLTSHGYEVKAQILTRHTRNECAR
jgi:N-acetyl-anhydromuramyl-L-alanine amidase AmpD